MEKVEEWRKGKEKKTLRGGGVVVTMSRLVETNYIQSQQTIPLLTEGRFKGSNVKSL